ncbi:MAG: hypothetical protein BWX80_02727 [Candidatus Hydrogenedentes bacterium ADurb.Bin101]|nr:MAG: hypothetical protein BWX80_02727 [Candidatus Hydrogenedentes bacterium ADurb.Bin101]HOH32121.1 hypothetical protein [Candidatus Hydrogenedentota bacterium]
MNLKILIGAVTLLVLVLALPMVMNIMRGPAVSQAPPQVAAPVAPLPPPPPPEPVPPVPAEALNLPVLYAPPPRTVPQYEQRQSAPSGPTLTAETLVGTAWEVATPYGPAVIELGPNGQATASHSLVGAVPGKWSVNGTKVTASASFMGQSMSVNAEIKGSTLKVEGQNIRRMR